MGGRATLEKGFTRLSNEHVEAFSRLNLGQHEWRVVWVIIRKTFGWNKKSDRISTAQIADFAGLDRRHTSRARRKLVEKQIIVEDGDVVMLNDDIHQWGVPLGAPQPRPQGGASRGTKGVPPEARGGASRGTKGVPPEAPPDDQTSGERKSAKKAKKQTSGSGSRTKGGVPPEAPQKTRNTGKTRKRGKTVKDISRRGQKSAPGGNGKQPPLTGAVWEAYSAAYRERYGVEPIRNATVNTQLANFIKRLGKDLAPLVAAYYVSLDTRYYVQKAHTVGPMLVDAEKLATECQTKTRITDAAARRADQSAERLSVFEQLLLEEQAKNG